MCGMPKIFISGDPGILLSPGFFKGIQGALGRRFIYCGINSFEIGHERFQILVGHIFARIAQLVDNAVLDVCLWKHCIDGVRKPSQVVCARDENVVDPSIFEAAEHHRPVLALSFSPTHMPRTSLRSSRSIPMAIYTAFFTICPSLRTW